MNVDILDCSRSSISDLHRLPCDWLKDVMQEIKSGDPESKLCATRRSAGVPFYVQVITKKRDCTCIKCHKTVVFSLFFFVYILHESSI